jgi:hypothetical protein
VTINKAINRCWFAMDGYGKKPRARGGLPYFANGDLTVVSDGTIESPGSNTVNHWCLTLYDPSALIVVKI